MYEFFKKRILHPEHLYEQHFIGTPSKKFKIDLLLDCLCSTFS